MESTPTITGTTNRTHRRHFRDYARGLHATVQDTAANFLVESTGVSAAGVFRLFHQALSDALSAERGRSVPSAQDEKTLSRAFTGYGARIGWENAPAYLFRSLPGHGIRAGMIDELLADTDYVLRADLRRLIPAADHAHTPAGVARASVLRLTPRAIAVKPPHRGWRCLASPRPSKTWARRFASTPQTPPTAVGGRTRPAGPSGQPWKDTPAG